MKIPFKNSIAGVLAVAALLAGSLTGSNAFAAENDLAKTLQERVAKLTPEQQAALLTLIDQLAPAKAIVAKMTPEESMRQGIAELEAAQKAKKLDVEPFMTHVSKDFDHYSGMGKDGMRTFLQGIFSSVSADGTVGIAVSLDKATYKVTGDKAEIYPVEASTPIGSATLTVHGKLEEDGVWRVIGVDGI